MLYNVIVKQGDDFTVKKFVLSVLLVMVLCTCASAALPSVTMLSTKTCPACRQMLKVFTEINSEYADKITTEHIYLEDKPELIREYNIRYVPVLVFRDTEGNIAAQEIGYRSKGEILKIFEKAGVNI